MPKDVRDDHVAVFASTRNILNVAWNQSEITQSTTTSKPRYTPTCWRCISQRRFFFNLTTLLCALSLMVSLNTKTHTDTHFAKEKSKTLPSTNSLGHRRSYILLLYFNTTRPIILLK